MGQSPRAIIAYGIAVNEDDKENLPWCSDEFDEDPEDWWRKELGYTPEFEIYDSNGVYIGGNKPSEAIMSQYFDNQRKWMSDNPMPFSTKLFGYEGTSIIITSPKYPYYEVEWGSKEINLATLVIIPDESFINFLEKYLPELGFPRWLLAAKLF